MTHPLNGATLRFNRANRHFTEAETLVKGWGDSCKDSVTRNTDGTHRMGKWPALPDALPLAVSDAIHNLRAALDYIVFELARLDSGQDDPDGTQFIIEDVKSDPENPRRGFDPRSRQYLKWLSPAHVIAIEHLQPYKGVHWTKTLRDISNPDKHRRLMLPSTFGRKLDALIHHDRPDGRFEGDPIWTPEGPGISRFDMEIDAQNTIAIGLPDPVPLIPTLRTIQVGVHGTIEAFKPEFKI